MYSSTTSLTLVLDGMGGQRQAPAALPPGMTRYPLRRIYIKKYQFVPHDKHTPSQLTRVRKYSRLFAEKGIAWVGCGCHLVLHV
jgi:hypothetical protein